MKKYRCTVCEWIYDPAVGDPDGGIAAGTAFEDIPEDWVCPLCGVGKDHSSSISSIISFTVFRSIISSSFENISIIPSIFRHRV